MDLAGRVRLFFLLARPPLVIVLALFACLGVAQAGHAADLRALAPALLVVVGFVTCAVAVNDLSDVAVDQVNLPADPHRPLVSGAASTLEMRTFAIVGATGALVVSAAIGWLSVATTAAGLLLALAYSLPPTRLSKRGVLAPLLLPFGFVAVPFLTGVLAAGSAVTFPDLALLAGLYLGFIGRILLKDFRDVRGDTLFGKRTFLVRHGRAWTCALSGSLWVAGSAALVAVTGVRAPVVLAYTLLVGVALVLLRALARSTSAHRDEALVGALASVGRGLVLTLLVHYGTVQAGTGAVGSAVVMAAVTAAILVWAVDVARHGSTTALFVPAVQDGPGGASPQVPERAQSA
jgi:4-hydroxybenzoate polyprenyltransferase